jgi:protein required for attachment to host cells
MPNLICWLLVADLDKSRIFQFTYRNPKLQSVTSIRNTSHDHEDSLRQKGTTHTGSNDAVRSFTNEHSVKRRHQDRYIHEVTELVNGAKKEGAFQRLFIAAGPQTMGLLRANLDKETQSVVEREFLKDYARFSTDDLFEAIKGELLDPATHLSA